MRCGNPKETGIEITVMVVNANIYTPNSLTDNKLASNIPLINAKKADRNFIVKLPIAAVLICLLLKTLSIFTKRKNYFIS
jgi:hypothetical protein